MPPLLSTPCLLYQGEGSGTGRVSTSVTASVAIIHWPPFRSDFTWLPRSRRRRWHLYRDIWRYILELMTRQVSYNIQEAYARSRSGVLVTTCLREIKRESSWDGCLGV